MTARRPTARRPTARRRHAASLALAGVVVLAGCAPGPVDESWTPPAWPAAQIEVVEAAPRPLDPAAFAQLTPQRLRNESVGVQARMSYLPGTGELVAPFNARVDALVREAIAQQSAARGEAYRPAVGDRGAGLGSRGCVAGSTLLPAAEVLADPELAPSAGTAIVCDLVVAQGSFFGQRLRVVAGSVAELSEITVLSDATALIYVDTATGEVVTAEDLWIPGAGAALRGELVEALRREAGGLSLAPLGEAGEEQEALIRSALASTVPGRGGTLVFTLPAGFQTPELAGLGVQETAGAFSFEVSSALVEEWASSFGKRLIAAAGTAFAGPDTVPAGREWVDCRLLPCVALTYDDGPTDLTPALLDHLSEARAAATFYVLGGSANRRHDTVRRTADEGHELGNHTWSHPDLRKIPDEEIRSQLDRTGALLRDLTGRPAASYRPPYGAFDRRVLEAAGMPAITWTVDTRDWAGPPEDQLLNEAIDGPRPGGIVLFHDTTEPSVRLAPVIIRALRDRGFTPVTVTQLFSGELPAGGVWRGAP